MDLAWTKSSEEVFKYFDVEEEKGLSDAQVKRNQEKYGPNGLCFYSVDIYFTILGSDRGRGDHVMLIITKKY